MLLNSDHLDQRSGEAVPVTDHTLSKETFHNVQSELPQCSFPPFSPVLSVVHRERSAPHSLLSSLTKMEAAMRSPSDFSSEWTKLPQLLFISLVLEAFHYFACLHLDTVKKLYILLKQRCPKLHTVLNYSKIQGGQIQGPAFREQ